MNSSVDSEIIVKLIQTISQQNGEALEQTVYDLETSLIRSGHFSDALFESLLEIMRRPDYLTLDGSWYLLRIFENKWDYLSEEQRSKLIPALEDAYGKLRDWMACFVISELLGKLVSDERALDTLSRLKNLKNTTARSMVPHALELLVRRSPNRDLAERAFQEIREMQSDPTQEVIKEVNLSLARLAKAGWNVSS